MKIFLNICLHMPYIETIGMNGDRGFVGRDICHLVVLISMADSWHGCKTDMGKLVGRLVGIVRVWVGFWGNYCVSESPHKWEDVCVCTHVCVHAWSSIILPLFALQPDFSFISRGKHLIILDQPSVIRHASLLTKPENRERQQEMVVMGGGGDHYILRR